MAINFYQVIASSFSFVAALKRLHMSAILIGYSKCLKRLLLSAHLIGYSLYHFLVALKRLLLFCYFIGYFTVQLQKQGHAMYVFPIQHSWYLSQISLLYLCYSQLIPYSLHMRILCISVAMYAICHYVLNTRQHYSQLHYVLLFKVYGD